MTKAPAVWTTRAFVWASLPSVGVSLADGRWAICCALVRCADRMESGGWKHWSLGRRGQIGGKISHDACLARRRLPSGSKPLDRQIMEIRDGLGSVRLAPQLGSCNGSRTKPAEGLPDNVTLARTCEKNASHELEGFLVEMDCRVSTRVVHARRRALTVALISFLTVKRRVGPDIGDPVLVGPDVP